MIRASDRLHCEPWELLGVQGPPSMFWVNAALAADRAEVAASAFHGQPTSGSSNLPRSINW